MTDKLETAQNSVTEFSSEMIKSVRSSLKDIVRNLDHCTVAKSDANSERPRGGKGLSTLSIGTAIVGGIGLVCGVEWAKWLLVAGAGGLGINYLVSRRHTPQSDSRVAGAETSISMSTRYEVIDKITNISDQICAKWTSRLEQEKHTLLQVVALAQASDDNKVKANYCLYVVNNITYTLNDWISRFETANTTAKMKDLISEYGAYYTGCIESALKKQIEAYKSAEKALDLH